MRLVAIYNEDADFSGADESNLTTVRTDSSLAAHYVQVPALQTRTDKEKHTLSPLSLALPAHRLLSLPPSPTPLFSLSASLPRCSQVTFTLGSKYGVNENSGLIPLDSVRAGKGTFFDDDGLLHKCLEWTGESGYAFASQTAFNTTLLQDCAPSASMCASPAAIPDHFASFNIPLG
eukprot:3720321-Rhodomonas_salina.1